MDTGRSHPLTFEAKRETRKNPSVSRSEQGCKGGGWFAERMREGAPERKKRTTPHVDEGDSRERVACMKRKVVGGT
jgi:hypothetical protein